jgi:hypothetical protein
MTVVVGNLIFNLLIRVISKKRARFGSGGATFAAKSHHGRYPNRAQYVCYSKTDDKSIFKPADRSTTFDEPTFSPHPLLTKRKNKASNRAHLRRKETRASDILGIGMAFPILALILTISETEIVLRVGFSAEV